MPDIVYDALNLEQGFNFRLDVQDTCGFITSMSLAQKAQQANGVLLQDIAAKNPATDGVLSPQNVVGIMRYFKWSGGLTDPMELKFNVTNDNRNRIFGLLHGSLPSTDVNFSFQIFNFDQTASIFYLAIGAASTNGVAGNALKGNIAKEGKDKLLLALPQNVPSEAIKSPQNWEVELTVMPSPVAQSVMYQYAPGFNMIKAWGVTVT